jgi:hypothetical protein
MLKMPARICLMTVMYVLAGYTLSAGVFDIVFSPLYVFKNDTYTYFNKKDTYGVYGPAIRNCHPEAPEGKIGYSSLTHLFASWNGLGSATKTAHFEQNLPALRTHLQKKSCHPEAPEGDTGYSYLTYLFPSWNGLGSATNTAHREQNYPVLPTHFQKKSYHPEAPEGDTGYSYLTYLFPSWNGLGSATKTAHFEQNLPALRAYLQKKTCHPEAPEGNTGSSSLTHLFPSPDGAGSGFLKQTTTDTINYHKRQHLCYAVGLGGTVITHIGLYQLWYKDYPSSKFHFFNDNREWLQMDKFGHAFSSYYLGVTAIEAAKWAGVPENKQWKWALFGSIFQDPIEIWDGFSAGWGASTGDLLANTFGTVLSAGQHVLWKEQKLTLKLSYTPSEYAQIRPNVLGSNPQERLLKDYNAQTYWLTYSPIKHQKWRWLGLALGYGAEDMVGGEDNIWTDKYNVIQDRSDIKRYRQYYLGLDYNLTRINTKRKGLKTLFFILNCIKLPSPALEFSNDRFKGHWLKF